MNNIIDRLREMRLPIMATEYSILKESKDYSKMSTDEVLEKMVDAEYHAEKTNTINRYRKQARFSDNQASLDKIDYAADRQLNSALISQLRTNEYIDKHRNVIILGATGSGKTFIANSLGINACQASLKVRFYRMTELLEELAEIRAEGRFRKTMIKLNRIDLIIIDDFLLVPVSKDDQKNLMELFEYRSRGKSLILCSQMQYEEWHAKLGGEAIADSICDRILNNCYEIIIQGESRRKTMNQ